MNSSTPTSTKFSSAVGSLNLARIFLKKQMNKQLYPIELNLVLLNLVPTVAI
eukprot:SAG31_NODE_28770_length_405_cov_0.918301_1_plen_52_part_00